MLEACWSERREVGESFKSEKLSNSYNVCGRRYGCTNVMLRSWECSPVFQLDGTVEVEMKRIRSRSFHRTRGSFLDEDCMVETRVNICLVER